VNTSAAGTKPTEGTTKVLIFLSDVVSATFWFEIIAPKFVLGFHVAEPSKVFFHFLSSVSESHASGFAVGQSTGISGSDLSRSGWVSLVTSVGVTNSTI